MLRTYLKYKPAWMQLIIFLGIAAGVFAIIGSIFSSIAISQLGYTSTDLQNFEKGNFSTPNAKPFLIIMQTIQTFALFIIPSYLFAYFADPNPNQFLQIQAPTKKRFFAYSIALVFLAYLSIILLGYINKQAPMPQWAIDAEKVADKSIQVLTSTKNISDLILNIVIIGFFAAVSEELFFRAVLQRIFIQWTKSAWLGIVVTALVFSFFHFQFSGFLPRFALGLVLGFLFWYSGSLWVNILFHFLFNSFQVILLYNDPSSYTKESPIESPIYIIATISIIAIIGTILLIIKMKKDSNTDYATLYPKEPTIFD